MKRHILAVPAVVCIGAWVQEQPPPRIESLIESFNHQDLNERVAAQHKIQNFWEQWTDGDLAILEKAERGADAEVAGRAREARMFILRLRAVAVHLPVTMGNAGALSLHGRVVLESVDDPARVAAVFTPYAKPPKDPTGKKLFTGIRLFLRVEREVPFQNVYAVLRAAARTMPVSDVVLVDPHRGPEFKADDRDPLLLYTLRAKEAAEDRPWKEKFLSEVNYPYQTQLSKLAEVEELTRKIAELEKRLKDK